MTYPIELDFYPPPGETIREELNERCISQKDFALRTGLTVKTVSQLMNGKAPITASIADKLEYVTGASSTFWLNLENNYRLYLKRKRNQGNPQVQEARKFAAQFPYADLVKRGACPATRNAVERQDALLRFFGVTDPTAFANMYIAPMEGAARLGSFRKWDAHAFAAWLRLAEVQAQKLETSAFSPARLQQAVRQIRGLLSADVPAVWGQVQETLASAGVAAVVEPELTGCRISGFSRFIAPQKALLAVSLRHGRVGTFWFNLFHELCHLLKHSKKKTFYNFAGDTPAQPLPAEDKEETEANNYSRNLLIPQADWEEFSAGTKRFTAAAIRSFAKAHRLPADIVLGRLEKEKLVPLSCPALKPCRQLIETWS